MIYLDVCGLCKNYYGYIDGKTKCKTYPDGQPTGFCSSKDEKCKERPKGGCFFNAEIGEVMLID